MSRWNEVSIWRRTAKQVWWVERLSRFVEMHVIDEDEEEIFNLLPPHAKVEDDDLLILWYDHNHFIIAQEKEDYKGESYWEIYSYPSPLEPEEA